MKRILRQVPKYALVFAACLAAFLLLLTAVYCIPEGAVAANREEGLALLEAEGTYPNAFFYRYASQLDNATDRLILQTTRVEDPSMNAFQAAMSMNDYARYWHGVQVALRPALTVLSYAQLRYVNMFVLLFLLSAVFSAIQQKLALRYAFAFLFSMAAVCVLIVPASLQFMPMFVLMLLAALAVLLLYEKRPFDFFPMLFFLIGILTSFFDLLTAPLLTFGIPAVCYLLLENKQNPDATFRSNGTRLFWIAFAWLAGYGICWASKWLIAELTLGSGAIYDALRTAKFRVTDLDYDSECSNRWDIILLNMGALRLPEKTSMPAFGALFALLAAFALFFRAKWKDIARAAALLPLVVLPYAWYVALGNHSMIHFWYTCRIQAVSLFALTSFLLSAADPARAKAFLRRQGSALDPPG